MVVGLLISSTDYDANMFATS